MSIWINKVCKFYFQPISNKYVLVNRRLEDRLHLILFISEILMKIIMGTKRTFQSDLIILNNSLVYL